MLIRNCSNFWELFDNRTSNHLLNGIIVNFLMFDLPKKYLDKFISTVFFLFIASAHIYYDSIKSIFENGYGHAFTSNLLSNCS